MEKLKKWVFKRRGIYVLPDRKGNSMNFKNSSSAEITLQFEKLVRSERKITHLILHYINEIESRKLYAELGFDSMFSYLTKGLGYSESAAYRRIQSARVLKNIPSVADKLESGALNLSQLTQLQKCIKTEITTGNIVPAEKTQKILESIEFKNGFETSKVLAVEFNQPPQPYEIVKPQSNKTVRLELTVDENDFNELKRARDLLSHVCPEGTWSDVIITLAKKFNKTKISKSAESITIQPR
ncbi:DUF222 domain-containing protein [Bdellovibrio bacteriovorus]|nr:DUF222 domain-containing protein [Bdellovibrio bacteriovorus]